MPSASGQSSYNMKTMFASIGLVAVGASSLHAEYAPGLTAGERTKLVTVSGSLRGFYDDNYTTQSSGTNALSSWGIEASPSISLNKVTSMTLFKASAVYDLKHYVTPNINDQTVQVSGLIDHKFTESQSLKVKDEFVVAQESAILDPVAQSTPVRTKGSNIRNSALADYLADLNKLLQVELTYNANVYHYQDKAYQPLLDRLEQLAGADLRFKFTPTVTGVVGYHYGDNSYSDKLIGGNVEGSIRDNRSHFGLAGVDVKVSKDLSASLRVGAQFFDYYNLHKTQVSPYADGSLNYRYADASYFQAGVKHLHNATDQTGNNLADPVLDVEATVAYLQLTQPLTFISPDLTAGVYGSFQHSVFNKGVLDGQSEDFYTASGTLAYRVNPNLSIETGYNYDEASSSIRPFTRNRVYLGFRASY